MDFNRLPILQMMTRKMSWLSHRTEVIAQNVANADTPNYRARDLKEVRFQKLVRKEGQSGGFTPARCAPRATRFWRRAPARPRWN